MSNGWKIQTGYTHFNSKHLFAMGDSYTCNVTLGVLPYYLYPNQLAIKLNALGCTVQAHNRGRSGNTTQNTANNMIYRFGWMFTPVSPDIAIIFAGENDATAGLTSDQTTANIQAMVRAVKFGVNGTGGTCFVAAETNLPAGQAPGTRFIVMADGSTTGGVVSPPTGLTATITGTATADANGNKITVWQACNGQAGTLGWNRIAQANTTPDRCSMVMVGGNQYMNLSSGGDTINTPQTANASLRAAQAAAATAEGVPFSDRYAFMRNRIVAGIDTQGSFSWHYNDGTGTNQHMNGYGHELVAECDLATIQAQTGWIAALSA